MAVEITLPYKFSPRFYQVGFWRAYGNGIKRFMLIWARRSGKDLTMTAFIVSAMIDRVGLYVFMYPTKSLGKKILWTGKDEDGMSFLDRIPKALIAKKNESELKITLINGSILQIQGSDKTEVVGQNIIGIIFQSLLCKMILLIN